MEKQIYHWQRFWCPRSSQINFTNDGYLYDPDEKWVRYNSDLVTLEEIANIPCLILLGEPGIGKSKAIERAREIQVYNQEPLFLDLHSYGSEDRLIKNLFESSQFIAWIEGNHSLYVFLDSLDECLLRIENVTKLLAEEFKQYQDKTDRLFLRIACRSAVWQSSFEEKLKQIWGKDKVKVYELAPLRWLDVRDAAEQEGIQEPDLFMQEIRDKKVVSLAIKPITLRFLRNVYIEHGQLSEQQTLSDLYLEGCRFLCDEEDDSDPRRPGRKGNLELDQRLIITARIAAVTVFANRNAIKRGRDQSKIREEDVLIQELAQAYERVNTRPLEVSEAAITEVLDTGLFSSRGSNRMGWAHQTYAEFLAAWYLTQHEISLDQIKTLLFSSKDPDHKLIPQLHETAAWLASMRTDVLEEIVKTDPDVLLRSDIPTDANFRALLVSNLLTQHEKGTLFHQYKNNYRYYKKLKHPGLVDQIRPYICDSTKPIDARHLAIDIAEVCEISELQEELVDIALDSSQVIYLRANAARGIGSVGDAATRLKLKSLVFQSLPEDKEDRLNRYGYSHFIS